ncbi:hypothetical protein ACFQ09_20745 [Massilia norwichensis]|uniref:Uncharacterized protein n=1 Tax=Massilia norwichensis TaxID=1442366 RepID=A0ABT2A7E1_9BURK|nr:hypothetical protein [Massilia norwichensis]MCS0590103.1 hypothetical protein [Massilia norwichensis]
MLLWAPQSQAATLTSYKVRNSKPMKDVLVQNVSFDTAAGLDHSAIKKINTALIAASASFAKEAKDCSAAAQGHPWGYKLTLEKVLFSEKYLSVVFAKSSVCAGSPDIEKEARVFSLPAGDLVPAKALFKNNFPAVKLVIDAPPNKQLIRLDEKTVETMIDDSKEILKVFDKRCDFFLKHTSYRIWLDGKYIILFPEFIQPQSFCQKEYLIQPED